MGIGPKKTWDAITASAYEMDPRTGKWTEKRPVPGVAGRLAASAVALHDQVFIFGGYVVDAQGGETTVSDLNVFVPVEDRYYRGKDIPVPVDDAVVGLYRDRYIFLIGGWSTSKGDAVRNVQVYDTDKDAWMQATPIPGTPVFGHAGAIIGDTIVYVDGAYKNPSRPQSQVRRVQRMLDGQDFPRRVTSRKLNGQNFPHIPATRAIASRQARDRSKKKPAEFISPAELTHPYNYNGIGYNGQPAEPSPVTFAFNVHSGEWETISEIQSRAHHGSSRPAGYAPRPGHRRRHGKRPAGDRQSDGCKTGPREVTLLMR